MKIPKLLYQPFSSLAFSSLALAGFLIFSFAGPTFANSADNDESVVTSSAPLSVAIVVETSSRVEPLLPVIQRTGVVLTQNVLGPDGEASLIGYNDEVDHLLDFTSNDDAIEKAVSRIETGTDGTHLYDAMSQALDLLQSRPSSRRRVIVVLGEPRDKGSQENLAHVLRMAHAEHVTIYSVELSYKQAQLRAPDEQAAPPAATPPGIFAMPPMPGTVQTANTEAVRNGNINWGNLLSIGARKVVPLPAEDNPLKMAAASTDGLYISTYYENMIQPAIDVIGTELHAQD